MKQRSEPVLKFGLLIFAIAVTALAISSYGG